MERYTRNQPVKYGVYVASRPPDICMVGEDGERLDGKAGASYLRLPTWSLFALAPALGGLFVFAFPALVVVALGYAAVLAVWKPAAKVANEHAYVAQMRWTPEAAYLQHDEGQEANPEADQGDALAQQVSAQRDKEDEGRKVRP